MIKVTTAEERSAGVQMQADIQKWIDAEIPVATIVSVLLQGAASLAKSRGFTAELFRMLAHTQFGFVFNADKPETPGLLS